VTYEETEQVYSKPLVITQADQMIVDFFTETYSTLVENVVNKIYFQAWATDSRADVYEFDNATLFAVSADGTSIPLLTNSIRTEHRGKGSFSFRHLDRYESLYI
jgi:hypothetical protein